MTLPAGQISLVDLNTSLNNSAAGPIYLTSFYANGSTKSRGMTGIPTTGAIGIQPFQGKRPIPVVSGMVGKYTGESWNTATTTLVDETGSGNDTNVNRGGAITLATDTSGLKYIYGGTTAGLRFPTAILPATYTLFHVSRYNGSTRYRIMNGANGNNWLSGHWGGYQSVAYHEGWLTDQTITGTTNWLLSTDQNSLYRGNQVTRGTSGGTASTRLSINYGNWSQGTDGFESSDWAVMCVVVYNRTLSLQEIQDMERYISTQYQIPLMTTNTWYSQFTRVNNANFTISQAGSDPDVQLMLNANGTIGSNTSLWYSNRIQEYTSFTVNFEIYIYTVEPSADGTSFNIGHNAQSFWGEGPNAPGFSIAFHLYAQAKTPGIYLYDSAGSQVGFYQVTLGTNSWIPVRIIYNRNTTNTWQIYYNNINVINYNNSSNESWVTSTSGEYFGFGSRNGGLTHTIYIRRFSLV
jgi:hypothetical protein